MLDRARRLPNRRELFWLRHALVNLQEDTMDKAERALPIPEHVTTVKKSAGRRP